MTTLDTLRECHALVWRVRAELESIWLTPNTEDALRFCATETAEAIDADLRLNSKYARNNDKSLSVEDELADALMMALTAAGRAPDISLRRISAYLKFEAEMHSLTLINVCAAGLAYNASVNLGKGPRALWELCYMIAEYPGMDLPERLTQRLERIKAKRLRMADDAHNAEVAKLHDLAEVLWNERAIVALNNAGSVQ